MLRFHTQTGGVTLTAQQPLNNVVRVALQAFAAVCGGTQSLHTNGYDEALALPSEEAAKLALRTQQVIAHESGATDTVDPFAGSYYVEALTDEIERRARRADRARRRARRLGRGDRLHHRARSTSRPGATRSATAPGRTSSSASTATSRSEARVEGTLRVDPASEREQVERLPRSGAARDGDARHAARSTTLRDARARRCEPAHADPRGAARPRDRSARSAARCARCSAATSRADAPGRQDSRRPRANTWCAWSGRGTANAGQVRARAVGGAQRGRRSWGGCSTARFGEIRITRLEPESRIDWESEIGRGLVELEPSGFGTRVRLTAQIAEPTARAAAEPLAPQAAPAARRAARCSAVADARRGRHEPERAPPSRSRRRRPPQLDPPARHGDALTRSSMRSALRRHRPFSRTRERRHADHLGSSAR